MPLILPGNVGSATASTGYNVANSCKFNGDAYVHKAVVAGNQRTFTYSFWTKRSTLNNYDTFIGYAGTAGGGGGTNRGELIFVGDGDDTLRVGFNPGGSSWSNYTVSDRVFRDSSAWYNIVLKVNTTSGTEAERLKIFVNGVSQTLSGYPSQNFDTGFNVNGYVYHIGRSASGTGNFIKGYLAEAVFIDGTALDADSFGEFDSDSGIWKPIDVSGLTFGNNGFHLDFEASGNLGNDANGGTDFTEVSLAATDQSTDTCTNNFATFNGLDFYHNATANTGSTLTEGSLYYQVASGNKGFARSTFAVSAGKWYFEVEANSVGKGFYGVCHEGIMEDGTALQPSAVYYYEAVPDFRSGDQIITTGVASVSAGDILGFALDMDNYALYISKNGTYMNSGNPASGSSRTGAISELFTNGRAVLRDFGAIFANVSNTSTTGGLDAKVNFGSPPYSESGGNSDGNGYGNFKTAPPSGYYSWNTKNLAEYG